MLTRVCKKWRAERERAERFGPFLILYVLQLFLLYAFPHVAELNGNILSSNNNSAEFNSNAVELKNNSAKLNSNFTELNAIAVEQDLALP